MDSNRFMTRFNFGFNIFLVVFLFFATLVYSDSNGIWINSGDVRGGIFGNDEQDVTSFFAFVNPVNVNSNLSVDGYTSSTYYCDENGENCINISDVLTSGDTGSLLPSGAVMAFNLDTCPDGWTAYADGKGKVIVGTGYNSDGINEKVFVRGEIGGEYEHAMTISEMPRHDHLLPFRFNSHFTNDGNGWYNVPQTNMPDSEGGYFSGWQYSNQYEGTPIGESGERGDSGRFNVMQPYVALLYCVKV